MISKSNKFIYIHVPKCGGTSILQRIQPLIYGKLMGSKLDEMGIFNHTGYSEHSFFSETANIVSDDEFESFYKWTVIRNTFDRLASYYQHNKLGGDWFYHGFCIQNGIVSFRDFIMNIEFILNSISGEARIKRSVEPLSDWLFLDGKNYFDDIFLLDNLSESWENICKKIGITFYPLRKYRVRNDTGKYTDWYDSDMVDMVKKVYAEEIAYFNFKFVK